MKKYIFVIFIIVCALTAALPGCADSRQTEKTEAQSSGSDTAGIPTESDADTGEKQVSQLAEKENETAEDAVREEENMDRKMIVEVGGSRFTATLEDNEAVNALVEMMKENPVTIQMSDYSGFEKVGALGSDLPASNRQTTTQPGDIVLYQGNQIVIFYGSNSWSYTRLGRIDDLTGWENALGDGDVTVTFLLEG